MKLPKNVGYSEEERRNWEKEKKKTLTAGRMHERRWRLRGKVISEGGEWDERGRAASEFSDSESIGHVVFFELESLHQLRRRGGKKSGNFVLIIVLLSLCDTRNEK